MTQEEIEVEAVGVEVTSQPVELYKILKLANAVSGGGEAKHAITEGYVIVNGEIETRKRRKIYDGDVISFNEEFYVLLCDTPPAPIEPRPARQKKETLVETLSTPKKKQKENKHSNTKKIGKPKTSKIEKPMSKTNIIKENMIKSVDDTLSYTSNSNRKAISF